MVSSGKGILDHTPSPHRELKDSPSLQLLRSKFVLLKHRKEQSSYNVRARRKSQAHSILQLDIESSLTSGGAYGITLARNGHVAGLNRLHRAAAAACLALQEVQSALFQHGRVGRLARVTGDVFLCTESNTF